MYFAANVTQQATLGQDTPLNPGSKQTFFSSNMCLHYSHAPGEELAEGVLGGVVGDLLYQRGPVHLGGCVGSSSSLYNRMDQKSLLPNSRG